MIFLSLAENCKKHQNNKPMTIQKFVTQISSILDQLKIPYIITGGIAVSVWGRPRNTADVDIVVEIGSEKSVCDLVFKLKKTFPKSYSDENLALDAFKRKSEFNIVEPEYGLKADFFISSGSEYQQTEIKRGRHKKIDGKMIRFISPEDLIISKLLWYRDSESTRQLEDIASVVETQKSIDKKYLAGWIKKHDLQIEWQKLEKIEKRKLALI